MIRTVAHVVALLVALAGMLAVGVLAMVIGPSATLPTLALLALAQALLFLMAIRVGLGLE